MSNEEFTLGDLVIFTKEALDLITDTAKHNPHSFHKYVITRFQNKTGIVTNLSGPRVEVLFDNNTVWIMKIFIKKI